MIILITVRFPPHKAMEVGEMFFKTAAGPLKPVFKKWQSFVCQDLKGGKGYHLIYTDREKADEAMVEINKIFTPFMGIEGFTAKTEVLMGMKETASLMKLMK